MEPRQFPIKTGTALPLGRGHAPPTAEQPPQPNPPIPLRVEILLQAALAHQLLRLGRENGEHDPNEGVVLFDEVYQLVAQDDNDAAVGARLEVMGINLRLKQGHIIEKGVGEVDDAAHKNVGFRLLLCLDSPCAQDKKLVGIFPLVGQNCPFLKLKLLRNFIQPKELLELVVH